MAKPKPIAKLLVDRFIGHQVDWLRLTAGETRILLPILQQIQRELEAAIMAADVDERTIFQERRLLALWKTAEAIIQQGFARLDATFQDRLVPMATVASEQTVAVTNAAIGVPLLTVGTSAEVLRAMIDEDTVLGLPLKDWWSRQAGSLRAQFAQTIRQGVFAGETLGQLLRRVRGTRERRFQDGIMAYTTRRVETLVRTAVQSVLNAARYETLRANDDVLEGHEWLAKLESSTCPACGVLSGQQWNFDNEPLKGSTEPFPGPPPLHPNCACTLVPVVKSWEQLIQEAREARQDPDSEQDTDTLGTRLDQLEAVLGKGTQASRPPVAAETTFETWLQEQDEETQIETLGRGKWQVWKRRRLRLSDLVDQRGRPLTLEQLNARV